MTIFLFAMHTQHLAVVVHGCVFYMNEVNWIALTDWIKDNALPPNQTALEGIHQWFEDGKFSAVTLTYSADLLHILI